MCANNYICGCGVRMKFSMGCEKMYLFTLFGGGGLSTYKERNLTILRLSKSPNQINNPV